MIRGLALAALTTLVWLLPSGPTVRPALAATECGDECVCSLAAAPLDFGGRSPFDFTGREATAVVIVTCDLLSVPSGNYSLDIYIRLSLDPGGSGNGSARTMRQDAEQLDYALFRDPARTKPWGDGGSGSFIVGDTLTLARPETRISRSYTVYGLLPGGQNRRVGGYLDTVMVTLEH